MLQKYTGKSREEIIRLSDIWESYLRQYIWNSKPRKTEKDINEFYANLPIEYLCHLNRCYYRERERYLDKLGDVKGLRILDFGCGGGDYGFELLKKGAKVDFYDIAHHRGLDFIEWKLKEEKLSAKVTTKLEELEKEYDIILCLDVLEHTLNPTKIFKLLYGKLPEMGKMILSTYLVFPVILGLDEKEILGMYDEEHIKESAINWHKNKMNDFIKKNMINDGFTFTKTSMNILLLYGIHPDYPYTTALYMEKELKKIGRVHSQVPNIDFITGHGIRDYIKKNDINLLIQVDSMAWHRIPRKLDIPTAAYSIDTFINTDEKLKRMERYDYKFYAQKKFVKGKKSYWLPLGVDTEIYKPLNIWNKRFDVAFCGTILESTMHHKRNEYLQEILENFYLYLGRDYNYGACKRYNEALMVFNYGIENLDGKGLSGVNMRVFEAMATGIPMLYGKADGMKDLGFEPGKHYIEYGDSNSIVEVVRKHKDMNILKEIKKEALKIIPKHTYGERVKEMMKIINK